MPNAASDHFQTLTMRRAEYLKRSGADQFIEFALALDVTTDYCAANKLPGNAHLCDGLRQQVLALTDTPAGCPADPAVVKALGRQVETIHSAAQSLKAPRPAVQKEPLSAVSVWLFFFLLCFFWLFV